MSSRRFFHIFGLAVAICMASGLPTRSQDDRATTQAGAVLKAGRNVNMVSGTTLPNGDPWLQRQNEPSIAVSTRNTLHLFAGANDYRTVDMPMEGVGGELPGKDGKLQAPHDAWLGLFKSFDGGQSWISTLLHGFPQDKTAEGTSSPLKGFRAAADPVVRAGTNGLFYYCGIAFNREKIPDRRNSVLFIARFIDNNNVEGGDSIKYLDTKIIADDGMQGSISVDKPWIAVDAPTNYSKNVTIDGQKIPAANVYVAYSVFKEIGNVITSEIRFLRSTDCGETWEKPIVLSKAHILNQGAVIAIDPRENGHVYVAWRRFNSGTQGSAIIVAKSTNYGKTFASVINVASLPQFPGGPFDQPSRADAPGTSFRTNSYPTMALDRKGMVYLAWAQRGYGPAGATRVVLTTSKDGFAWTTPATIDNPSDVLGHQFMPSLVVASGKVTMVWYDQREDYAGNNMGFSDFICDNLRYRHTIDVRVAQASTADYPYLKWTSAQVSRYLFSLEKDPANPDEYWAYQAQFNPPNYPLFQSGTLPFHGDYIDISPSPWFVRDSKGRWRFNTNPSDNPLFHAVWTDNRDVRPPLTYDWVSYTPPTSPQDSEYISAGQPSCAGGQQPGMRNQNIYTSRITTGIETGSPANSKALNLDVPRAFVIFVKNNTDILRSFRLTISSQPLNGTASFLQFEPLDFLDVSIAPASTISRQVFVDSTDTRASVTINIEEIDAPGGTTVANGLTSSLILNGDTTSPAVSTGEETHQPEIGNPNIRNWYVNPNVVNPNIRNADIINDDIVNPNIRNINTTDTNVVNPNIVSASLFNPNIRNADLLNPNIINPNIRNPNIRNASPEEISVIDVEWPVKNAGNTASSFTFKVIAKEALPPGLYAQLIIYKVHYTPAVAGEELGNAGVNDCELKQEPHHQILLNVVNPNIIDPDIVNPNIRNPNIRNAAIENATFVLEPSEEALVNLRIIQTEQTQEATFRTQQFPLPIDIQSFVESLGGAVTSQSVDSQDAEQGITEPPADATTLIITTTSLPPGLVGRYYPADPYTMEEARLKAVGGTEPYSWWVNPSDLPPGLNLGAATGQIFGTPTKDPNKTYPCTYRLMAQVTDAGSLQQTHSQLLSIGIVDPTVPPPPLSIITPSPLPPGTVGKLYGATLEAAGGVWPYAWTLVSGSLPTGLNLDSGGFISGTPGADGTYSFRVRVTDSGAPVKIDERDYTLTIQAATAPTYTISGTITIGGSGTPLPGVLLRGLPGAPTTNAAGFYTDTVPQNWSGTVIPFKAGYQFMPSERSYANITSHQLNQDYITYTVDLDYFELSSIAPQTAGTLFPITITATDRNGNTVTTYNDPNTLSDTTGTISPASTGAFLNGVWAGNVTIRKAAPSVTITTSGGGKTGLSNVFSVTVGTPSAVKIEDAPDGTGTEVDTKTLGVGNHVSVHAISRDIGNNFIANVEVAWSLIDMTGGVVDSDLVPAADNKSALFTAHSVGTARIKADHASLVDDTTGIITVVETQPDDKYEENDSFAAAKEISLGTHKDLVLSDEDWYKVYVSAADAGKDLKAHIKGISYPAPTGGRDLDFSIFNSSEKLLGAVYSGSDDETLYIADITQGWYYIGHNYLGQVGTIYSMTVEVGNNFGIGYFSGRVADKQGNGLESVFVEARSARSLSDWTISFPMITTDSNGEYKIGYSPGEYTVFLNSIILPAFNYAWAANANYVGVTYYEMVTIVAGTTFPEINAQLEEGGAISGRVTNRDGNGIGFIVVSAYNSSASQFSYGWTNANGEYRIPQLRTGNYKVRFRPVWPNGIGWYENAFSFEEAVPVPVRAGSETYGINAQLGNGGMVSGRVTDISGTPVQGAQVNAYDVAGMSLFGARTDINGDYTIARLPAGPVKIFYNASTAGENFASEYYTDKYLMADADPVLVQEGLTTTGINAQLAAGGAVSGRVTDAAGLPIWGVTVSCFAMDGDRTYSASSDASGNYLIKGLLPGNYKIRFQQSVGQYRLEWYNDRNSFAAGDTVTIGPDDTVSDRDAQLSLNAGGSISGRVTNGSGIGIEGVPVQVYDSSRLAGISSARTDAAGYYSVSRIPGGDAKVFINADYPYLREASEYYDNKDAFAAADHVGILEGQTKPLNDAVLGLVPALAIMTQSLPDGEVRMPYNAALLATGGRPFYHWSLISGTLPDGLTFNSKGEIHGTPTTEGTYNFSFRVIDSTSPTQQYGMQNYSLIIGAYTGPGYVISGRITQGGSPLAGVLLDGLPGSPVTNAAGEYLAPITPGWSGTVTPTLAGFAFNPPNRTYTAVTSSFTNQDYAASAGYTISGTTTLNASPLSGVLMSGLPGNPRTNLSGFYTAAVPSGWTGTVTPSLPGISFSPPNRSYTTVGADQPGQNYVASYVGGQDDAYEENDSMGAAAELSLGTHAGLVLADEDWFKVFVPSEAAGKDLRINLTGSYFPNPNSRGDLDFMVVNSGGKLLSANYSSSGNETIFISDVAEGWYFIGQVYFELPAALYSLTAEVGDNFGIGYLEGRVTDLQGKGIEGVYVELYTDPPDWSRSFPMMTTGADGHFKVGYFPGKYTIRFNLNISYLWPYFPGVNYIGEIYNAGEVIPIFAGSVVSGIDASLEPGGTISGRVLDPAGNPLNQAIVYAYAADNTRVSFARTDTNGYYNVQQLRTGNYKVRFRMGNTYSYEWFDNTYSFEDGLPVAVQSGLTTPNIDARLEDWASTEGFVEGRVTNVDGYPIQAVTVSAYEGTGFSWFSARTDANGNYRLLRLAPGPIRMLFNAASAGEYYVSEYYPDKATLPEAVPVPIQAGQTVYGVDAQLAAGGAIAGRVTDAADNPFQTVSVTCFAVGSDRFTSSSTDLNGNYLLKGLMPGDYKVRFTPPAGIYMREWYDDKNSFGTGDTVSVSPGGTTSGIDAELTINEGGTITGRVTDGSGAGVKGVSIWVYDSNKLASLASSETDADGYYTASKILAGEAKVFFNTDLKYLRLASEYYNNRDTFAAADPVNIVQSQTTPLNDVVLAPLPSLAIMTLSLPGGEVGVPYNVSLQATGGRPFYYWSLVSGSLPDGLTFNSKGEIRGTPPAEGTFPFTVRVIDSTSPAQDQQWVTYDYSLAIGAYAGTGYLISGRVTVDGSPLAGVVMEGLSGSPATNPQGEFVAPVSPGWSGTVTPTLAGYAFNPANRTYTTVASNFTNQDYAASVGYSISGAITMDGSPLSGVLMSGLPGSPRTNLSGFYTAAVTSGWSGTVTPSLPGFTFNPPDRNYSGVTSNQPGQDYTAGYPGGADDVFEENDDLAHAATIEAGTLYTDLVLNDQDWFKVNVSAADAGKDMKVHLKGISYPDPSMRHDMDFQIVSASGKLLSYSISRGDDETAYICGLAEGWYYIGQVYIEPIGSVYSLSVEVGLPFGIGYVEGRVTNELGDGIPDIYVELYSEPLNWDISRPLVTTDAAGNFRVGYAPGNYTVRYNLQDFYHQDPYAQDVNYIGKTYNSNEVVTIAIGATVSGINVELSPGGTISGRVIDPNGNGINYAGVYVYAADKRRLGFAWSNPNGDYFVDRLPTGNYKVRFRQNTRSFADEWYENTSTFGDGLIVPAQAGSTTPNINARLEDWMDVQGCIAGRVTDGSGKPLSSVQVVAYDLAGLSVSSSMTDGDGNYQIWRLPPGQYRIWFNASTADGNFVSEYYPDKLMLEEAVPVSVESGQTAAGIDAQLAGGGTITGRVTNAQGDAYPWLNVICFDVETERYYAATTDVNGNYTFQNLLPDSYKIRFRPGWNYAVEWYSNKGSFATGDPIIVGAGQTVSGINAELLQNGGFISGRVTDSLARGIPGVVVYVRDGVKQGVVSSVETGADGSYSVPRIPSGDVKVHFDADYYRFAVASEYFNDKPTHAAADLVLGALGQTTPNINAILASIPGLGIVTTSLPSGEIGAPYSATLQATGGREFYFWSVISGTLPNGLSLSSKGAISGTPTDLGEFDFTVGVVDSTNPQQQDSQDYTLTIQAYSGSDYLVSGTALLGGSPLPGVTLTGLPGNPVTGAQGRYVVAVPPGWSGTVFPGLPGYAFAPASRSYSNVTSSLENQDYAASLGHSISGIVTFNGSPLQGVWMNGLPGNPRTKASGFYISWVADGWSGTVTPSFTGYTFTPVNRSYTNVTTDQSGQDFAAYAGGALRITTNTLPGGTKNSPYSATLHAAYGTSPYSWDITQGQLPTDLTLDADGQISGTPTEAGDFSISVRVMDSSSPPQSATRSFGLNISPANQAFWTTTYPYGGWIFPQGIVLDPGNSSTIYITPLWRGIYRSQDSGDSWSSITDDRQLLFDRTNVRILRLRSSNEFYTAGDRGIFKSVDAGLNWTEIDTGISARVTALALHPTNLGTLYAGTQTGQVFKSTNGGLSWQNLSNGLPAVEIRTITVDPYDTATVYAGTLSQGVFRSTGDASWQAANGDSSLVRVENIVFDPAVASTFYVAGEDSIQGQGIFKTINGSVHWLKLDLNVGIRWEPGFYIAVDPDNLNTLYVAAGNFVHKSTDGGTSWTALPVANSGVTCVVIDPATPTTLYAGTEDDGVLKSTDGMTWSESNTGLRGLVFPHSKSHSLHIDATNPNYLYAGSINGGYRSLNGGQTWEKMDYPDRQISSILTHPASPGEVFTLHNQFWKSADNGRSGSWSDLGSPFCCYQGGDLGIVYTDELVIYAGVTGSGSTPGGVYRSVDGGATWEPKNSGLTDTKIHTLAMHPTDTNIIFVGTQSGWPSGPSTSSRLFRTTDGGENWQQITCGLPDFLSINQIVFYPGDPNIMYLAAEIDNGGVYRSDDGGNCWYKIFNGNINTIAVHPSNPNVVYAGAWNAGGFYVTLDGGQTWSTLNGGLPLDPGIESMAVDPRNPYHIFIGTTAGVYETTLAFDLAITTTSLPPAIVNQAYAAGLEAVGGTIPYSWEIASGSLPPGMGLDLSNGHIEGLTTAAGSFDFTVRLTDNTGQAFTKRLNLVVLNQYILNAAAAPAEGGSVTKNPDKLEYLEGSLVEVNAAPKTGYLFTGWSGDASGKTPLIHVQMTQNKNITANFALLVSLSDYHVASSTLPGAAGAGEVIGGAVSVTAGNQGSNDPYLGAISVGLYLSSDAVITTNDLLLWKGRSAITALSGGGTAGVAIDPQLQIPTTVTAGDYYIGVLVDEDDVIAERDEGNNSAGRAIKISSPGYGHMDIMGGWPYGSLYGLDVDPARNLAFVGNGGLFQVLDVSNPANPRLRSQFSLAPNCPSVIKIVGTTAFVANQAGGLKAIDISDPLNLRVIGTCTTIQNARGLDISGSHAYIADYHQGFRIIDISNPSAPVQTAFLPFPGRTRLVKVFGNYAYVQRGRALNESQGDQGVQIIDISDPAHPVLKALIPVGSGDVDIDASGHFLFIPTSNNYLRIYDVSNPEAPFEVASYTGARNPTAVAVVGNRAYVPDQNEQKLVILDITDAYHPVEVSTYRFTVPVSPWIPRVIGNLCYISSWYDSLRIVDFSNLAVPKEIGSYDVVGLLNYADISNNHAYVANSRVTQTRLKVLDISRLPDITETATLNTPYPIYDLMTSGNHAYLAANTSGLRSIDISNPPSPTEVGSCEALRQASDVAISGNFAYVADGSNGLRIVDITTPSNPILRSTLRTEGVVYQVSHSGKYAYLAAASGGLRIIDVSDPLNPWEVGSLTFAGEAYNVNVAGDYAYVNDNYLVLRVINVSNPASPVEVSTFNLYYTYGDIGISGNFLFVPDWIWGVRVLDVSNPSSPVEVAVLRELFLAEEVIVRENRIYVVNRDTGFYVLEYRPPINP